MPVATIVADASDGVLRCFHATYLTARSGGGTLAVFDTVASSLGGTGQSWDPVGSDYRCREGFFNFDLASIPADATVTAAVLKFASAEANEVNPIIEVRANNWGEVLATGDWVAGASVGALTLLASYDCANGWVSGTRYDFVSLAALITEVQANIATGKLRVLLHTNRFRTGTAPSTSAGSDDEAPGLHYSESTSGLQPQLEVTYTLPPPPPPPPPPAPRPQLPAVLFSLDGKTTEIRGWRASAIAYGGFDTMSGVIQARDALRAGQGAPVRLFLGNDDTIWEGRLSLDPQIHLGEASVSGNGHRIALEKRTERLLLQTRDVGLMTQETNPPHLYAADPDKIAVAIQPGAIAFTVNGGVALVTGDEFGAVMWVKGALISRYAFRLEYVNGAASYKVRAHGSLGPSGAKTLIATHSFGAGNGVLEFDQAVVGDYDQITFSFYASANVTPANNVVGALVNVRVNGVAVGDEMIASDAMTVVGERMGWDLSRVATNRVNVLPQDWRESWAARADYLCDLTECFWRADEGPSLVYEPWGSELWDVSFAANARPLLDSTELFNEVVVDYNDASNIPVEYRLRASPDPLARYGITNSFPFALADTQEDDVLAADVAARLLERHSVRQWAGRLDIVGARDAAGRGSAYAVRPGAEVRVGDWGPAEAKSLRITEVEYSQTGVSLGIESAVSIAGLLARSLLGGERAVTPVGTARSLWSSVPRGVDNSGLSGLEKARLRMFGDSRSIDEFRKGPITGPRRPGIYPPRPNA